MRRAIGAGAALAVLATVAACTASSTAGSPPTSATPVPTPPTSAVAPPSSSSDPASSASPPRARQRSGTSSRPSTQRTSISSSESTSASPPSDALPLGYSTGRATQVIIVLATSHSSTSANLQAWHRSGSGWARVGPSVHAWLGTGGIGAASEQSTATPQGSFTLTQAFGRFADPGTALPYRQTTPADWWISQPGHLYNTEQHCAASCQFTLGEPNEHLYYATPFYEYAVVIDYNRHPVVQGAGSAFFLHVTVGEPTQGCVSIARDQLVRILRWLRPAAHPRILMGVG